MGHGNSSMRRNRPYRLRTNADIGVALDFDLGQPDGDGNNHAARTHVIRRDGVYFHRQFRSLREPRISPSTKFIKHWKSPCEKLPYVEPKVYPIIMPRELCTEGDEYHEDCPQNFPRFLKPLLNKNYRLLTSLHGCSNSDRSLEGIPKGPYLLRNLRFLRIKFMQHPLGKGIRVALEENHCVKRNRTPRYRPMYPRTIILDHINQSVLVCGVDFQLIVNGPPADARPTQFPNDEIPQMVGTYCRELDTQAQMCIEWKVALYRWYNQTKGYDMGEAVP
ncbi:uncharacterized protein LOC124285398 [Haliotis rubra]|uniref:uncharacterized protein LOC124285398 n=1 Tax=Haliotis rubra TaxID=36100 RepID=UPI001EE5F733|nr:uncharacterized protein LOC124285398 [Haliotis rubra]